MVLWTLNVMLCAGKCLHRAYTLLSHKKMVESCISGWSGLAKNPKILETSSSIRRGYNHL